ncbi:hypothetical protein SAMN04488570_3514 [Nocardioides scoriae]|uniref:Uncharacterized protein n=1 Tax=Nocardioides scoriae TaxID=642780 RepID=A0A1H1XKJ1_9ACTN|nr:hypothetical protein [Nocardioides scoriae]SDT09591.1 hypothetical protein SAMN04488570_3514 [Nocardioides scoriae]
MTFTYRDLRAPRVAEALAALPPDASRGRLEREREALATDGWAVADRTLLVVTADWLWRTSEVAGSLLAAVGGDPVTAALGGAPLLDEAQASAVEALGSGPGPAPVGYLDRVREAVDGDEAVVTELVHAALADWLEGDRVYPLDDVGVLLPLRLETLFDGPATELNDDPDRWKLSLRVVPDEASVRRDDAHVSAGELAGVRRFWAAARRPGAFDPAWLDSDAAGVAWAQLCRQVAPERAAWLLTVLEPVVDGDALVVEPPAGMPEAPQPNRIGGLPAQLTVWAVTRDQDRLPVGRLPMDPDATIDPDALVIALPDQADTAREAWWSSWTTAVAVGLGGEWLLDVGVTPESLDALFVLGLGDDTPDEHLRAQVDAGELGVLRLGAPTNTVHGAPAADLALDADGWRSVARARLAGTRDDTVGRTIEQHLTGSNGVLPSFPGAGVPDDTQDSKRMAQALWPPLLGHWLADLWERPDDAFRVNRWAFPPVDDGVPSPADIRDVLHRDPEDPTVVLTEARFAPEGPLMPLRIGDQPYGLLPTTALSLWQAADPAQSGEQLAVEDGMAKALAALRGEWAAAARRDGNVVGASTERFMELLSREASSRSYSQRSFLPVEAWATPYQLGPDALAEFGDLARTLYGRVIDLVGTVPGTTYLTNGHSRRSRLPLVRPRRTLHRVQNREVGGRVRITRFLSLLLDADRPMDLSEVFATWWVLERGSEWQLRSLPDSLLIRLLTHAMQIDADWMRGQVGGDEALRVLRGQVEATRAITSELDQPDWNVEDRDPDTGEERFVLTIPDARRLQLERALRATIDSSAHRIDPWVTGFAWQRLQAHSSSDRHAHRLGAYGWVDGPFLGEPGPTGAGRLHTPSYDQTLAAVVLRDKFLSSEREAATSEGGRNPWQMDISSARARLAEEIADEVRLGFHVYEIVGRHVEHVVGNHQQVKALRTSPTYAMRPDRRDPHEVCNGIDALAGLLAGDPAFPLDADQTRALQTLHDALDTYGDLLVADGVVQLVGRQVDRAAETMDAAAGFSRPPTFEFLRTPPSGYQVQSLVLATVPHVDLDDVPLDAGPVRLADPSLAAFVEDVVGDAWTWRVSNRDDSSAVGQVTLADLRLTPTDTLALSEELLAELVRRHLDLPEPVLVEDHNREWLVVDAAGAELGRVHRVELEVLPATLAAMPPEDVVTLVRDHLAAPADSSVQEAVPADLRLWVVTDAHGALLGLADVGTLGATPEEVTALDVDALHRRVRLAVGVVDPEVTPPGEHLRTQHLAAALGNRPAAGRDVVQDPVAQQAIDAEVYQELADRYAALHVAGRDLVAALRASDDVSRPGLLRRALAWGITPVSRRADADALWAALLDRPPSPDATPAPDLAAAVADVLQKRLDDAPQPADLAPVADLGAPLDDHEDRKRVQHPDGVPTLAGALADLALPDGTLGITASWSRTSLIGDTALEVGATEDLDESWLTVVAAVRPALARLEALQLGLDTPLDAWSSAPGDPFLTATVAANLATRSSASVTDLEVDRRFVAAYGTPGAWAGERVAVGLVDSFSEAVPMPQRSTSAAFGFNAPAARAPQAILLAVPPVVRQRLEEDLLLQVLVETRELAHARTAHLEDLGELQSLAPTTWLQSSGPSRVRLEPYPLFTT